MIKIKLQTVVLVLGLAACSDFLEESSLDEVRPSTVNDLEEMLLGDGYQDDHNFYYLTEPMTDNMKSIEPTDKTQSYYEKGKWAYLWDLKMFDEDGGGYNRECWEKPYSCILGCNLILDYLDAMSGEASLRENLRGEALALRGWYYLQLVNFFGVAYNQGDPRTELAVPLKLESTVTGVFFARNTVAEVYAQIERDLLTGNRLLVNYDYDRTFFRIGHVAAKAILSRMYLYMENWDKAIAYADSVLNIKPDLLDLNTTTNEVYESTTPDEIIWGRKYNAGYSYVPQAFITPWFIPSDDFLNLYDKEEDVDIRKERYCLTVKNSGVCMGVDKAKSDYGGWQGIRTAELYLNRAEGYARKYLETGNEAFRLKALADLNHLREFRINKGAYREKEITGGQELLDFCMDERRRELSGETNHRYCDVRRLGLTLKHKLYDGTMEYTQDMTRFVLPIPETVMELNPDLVQNK